MRADARKRGRACQEFLPSAVRLRPVARTLARRLSPVTRNHDHDRIASPAGLPVEQKLAASKKAAASKGTPATHVVSVRLLPAQVEAVERWRSAFVGLDQIAAVRVLIDLGLMARPRSVIDPLALASATHQRRPGKAKI